MTCVACPSRWLQNCDKVYWNRTLSTASLSWNLLCHVMFGDQMILFIHDILILVTVLRTWSWSSLGTLWTNMLLRSCNFSHLIKYSGNGAQHSLFHTIRNKLCCSLINQIIEREFYWTRTIQHVNSVIQT